MSAAHWRRAMNAGAAAVANPVAHVAGATPAGHPVSAGWGIRRRIAAIRPRHLIGLAALLLYPWIATPFFTFQIGGQSLALGLIALSLTFLAGSGGMVSLAQMTVAGIAAYVVAIFGFSAADHISLGWPWWLAASMAVGIATIAATFIGWLSVRTEGIYTIMITLAIGVAFQYLCVQNYSLFNGFQGFQKVEAPVAFGVNWHDATPFYYLALFCALGGYWLVQYVLRAPFGLALQGVRDNPRRMNALGFDVVAHRVAAYTLAGFLAAVGGVLLVWYDGLVTPGTVGTGALIKILIIAVLGGMRHPLGAFIGAVIYVLLQNFAIDLLGNDYRERFNTVIGGVFLVIVLFSPDGMLGWWVQLRTRFAARRGPGAETRRLPQQQGR